MKTVNEAVLIDAKLEVMADREAVRKWASVASMGEFIDEHVALAQALLRALQALSGLLPLDGRGRCFRCNFQEPDEHKMHIDRDNLWDGDQPCLDHETYTEARAALADTELEEAMK